MEIEVLCLMCLMKSNCVFFYLHSNLLRIAPLKSKLMSRRVQHKEQDGDNYTYKLNVLVGYFSTIQSMEAPGTHHCRVSACAYSSFSHCWIIKINILHWTLNFYIPKDKYYVTYLYVNQTVVTYWSEHSGKNYSVTMEWSKGSIPLWMTFETADAKLEKIQIFTLKYIRFI